MMIRHIKLKDVPEEKFVHWCIEKHVEANKGIMPKLLLFNEALIESVVKLKNISSPSGFGFNYQGILLVRTIDIKTTEIVTI